MLQYDPRCEGHVVADSMADLNGFETLLDVPYKPGVRLVHARHVHPITKSAMMLVVYVGEVESSYEI